MSAWWWLLAYPVGAIVFAGVNMEIDEDATIKQLVVSAMFWPALCLIGVGVLIGSWFK